MCLGERVASHKIPRGWKVKHSAQHKMVTFAIKKPNNKVPWTVMKFVVKWPSTRVASRWKPWITGTVNNKVQPFCGKALVAGGFRIRYRMCLDGLSLVVLCCLYIVAKKYKFWTIWNVPLCHAPSCQQRNIWADFWNTILILEYQGIRQRMPSVRITLASLIRC